MATLKQQKRFARKMSEAMTRTFFEAYFRRQRGCSLEQMLLEHDIEAAYDLVPNEIQETMRTTIKNACRAVDAQVPYPDALAWMINQIEERIDEYFTERKSKQNAVAKNN